MKRWLQVCKVERSGWLQVWKFEVAGGYVTPRGACKADVAILLALAPLRLLLTREAANLHAGQVWGWGLPCGAGVGWGGGQREPPTLW